MRNIYVPLPDATVQQLRELAQREYRDTKAQAAWLILDGLRRADLESTETRAATERAILGEPAAAR